MWFTADRRWSELVIGVTVKNVSRNGPKKLACIFGIMLSSFAFSSSSSSFNRERKNLDSF